MRGSLPPKLGAGAIAWGRTLISSSLHSKHCPPPAYLLPEKEAVSGGGQLS